MDLAPGVSVEERELVRLCERHGIRRLALFGSAIHGDFNADSDLDLLVDFAPERVPGLIGLAGIELELQDLIGRKVDLRTPGDLSQHFRSEVAAEARALYDAA